jgi:hypothetical protein
MHSFCWREFVTSLPFIVEKFANAVVTPEKAVAMNRLLVG